MSLSSPIYLMLSISSNVKRTVHQIKSMRSLVSSRCGVVPIGDYFHWRYNKTIRALKAGLNGGCHLTTLLARFLATSMKKEK